MNMRMTWEEMKKEFREEWLLIIDYELDESGRLLSGVVARHSSDKKKVSRLPTINKSRAFRYTGQSTFAGLRSHAKNNYI